MSTINKRIRSYPNFAQDMRNLNNLANAYNTCQTKFRDVWKQKWYEMVAVIAKRVEEWHGSVDKFDDRIN